MWNSLFFTLESFDESRVRNLLLSPQLALSYNFVSYGYFYCYCIVFLFLSWVESDILNGLRLS